MEETTRLIVERFTALANTDLAEFRQFFRSLRKLFPQQAAEACLLYIAQHGVDSAAHSIAFWFGGDASYIQVLLDEKTLGTEQALKAIAIVKDIDPQFLTRFSDAIAKLESPSAIQRGLSLVSAIGDYKPLLPWLRQLGEHPDDRIRSRAAKLLCDFRPSKGLIGRHMNSEDPRVRANALETLTSNAHHIEEARSLFRAAVNDKHHRVVANALVGLYAMGDKEVVFQMIEFSKHEDHLFRAAMAWAMGFVKDKRAIPRLRDLTTDSSPIVRKRALHSLLILESLSTPGSASDKPISSETATDGQLKADLVPVS